MVLLRIFKQTLLNTVIENLSKDIQKGMFNAWNANLPLILKLVDTVLYEKIFSIYKDCNKVLNDNYSNIIVKLCIYDFIQENLDLIFSSKLLNSDDINIISNNYKNMCKKLLPNINEIIDCYKLPKFIFNIPLLNEDLLNKLIQSDLVSKL